VPPPGSLVARNLYPDLTLQRIQWLRLKVHPIPTEWPKLEIRRIDSGAPPAAEK
jgi:hypothetical protein